MTPPMSEAEQDDAEMWATENRYSVGATHVGTLLAEIRRLRAWVNDLQSGMFVNCVYCGHRYGPGETTPVTMADALKAHIEACHEHPMSKLREAHAGCEALLQGAWKHVAHAEAIHAGCEEHERQAVREAIRKAMYGAAGEGR